MDQLLRLAEMIVGQQGTVFEILGGAGLKHRLAARGVRPGATIEKVAGSPWGGPAAIRIEHIRLAVGHGMASKVLVEVKRASEP